MERSVRSQEWEFCIYSRHLQLLLADSYMCLPSSDFPRPCYPVIAATYPVIAAIRPDKEGGPEKPLQESASKTTFQSLLIIPCRRCQMATCLTRLDQRLHNTGVIRPGGPQPPRPKSGGLLRAGSVCSVCRCRHCRLHNAVPATLAVAAGQACEKPGKLLGKTEIRAGAGDILVTRASVQWVGLIWQWLADKKLRWQR